MHREVGQGFLGVLFALIMLTMAGEVRADSSDEAIRFVRAFFDIDQKKPQNILEEWKKKNDRTLNLLSDLSSSKFQPKEIWANRDYVFGFGTASEGSTIVFAWKNREDALDISMKDLSGIYLDERMNEVTDEKDLKKWKKMRDLVVGALIDLRKGESHSFSIFPVSEKLENKSGREALDLLTVQDRPLIVKIRPVNNRSLVHPKVLASLPAR